MKILTKNILTNNDLNSTQLFLIKMQIQEILNKNITINKINNNKIEIIF